MVPISPGTDSLEGARDEVLDVSVAVLIDEVAVDDLMSDVLVHNERCQWYRCERRVCRRLALQYLALLRECYSTF